MMVTTARTTYIAPVRSGLGRRVVAGLAGGLVGGIVFGMLMGMMGMLTTIAATIGSDSILVGLGVHLMMSLGIGLLLTVPLGRLLTSTPRGLLVGILYGMAWWVAGPLIAMPLMLGMPVFTLDQTALLALMGHVIYGGILGLVASVILKQRNV